MAYNKQYDQIPLWKLIKAFDEMTGDVEYNLKAYRIPEKKREMDRLLVFYNSILGRLKEYEQIEAELTKQQLKLDL